MGWEKAASKSELDQKQRVIFKKGPKQIAVFKVDNQIFAVDNRCPHQGYPLKEGVVDSENFLTCNWHNWKFDLKTGKCVTGGDNVRAYKTKQDEGSVWVELSEPSKEELTGTILASLKVAVDKNKMGRLIRDLAKLHFSGIDPLLALEKTLQWTFDKFNDGISHAHAAAADWLKLYADNKGNVENQLICLAEAIDFLSSSVYRAPSHSFSEKPADFSHQAFIDAIEQGDEHQVLALVLGALEAGWVFKDLEKSFTEAALMHYNDFGHSLIFIYKASVLIQTFGNTIEKQVVLGLARNLCRTTREDLLPEFKNYHTFLAECHFAPSPISSELNFEEVFQKPVNDSLAWVVSKAKMCRPEDIYGALLASNAKNMLYFDTTYQEAYDKPVADNVDWLDFSHAITFANAVRHQCQKFPEYWKQGLLQLACFNGRNVPYCDLRCDVSKWTVADSRTFLSQTTDKLLDHGIDVPLIVAHRLKTFMAVKEELKHTPAQCQKYLLAAANRFLNSPIKQKHIRRKIRQNLTLVGRDYE